MRIRRFEVAALEQWWVLYAFCFDCWLIWLATVQRDRHLSFVLRQLWDQPTDQIFELSEMAHSVRSADASWCSLVSRYRVPE